MRMDGTRGDNRDRASSVEEDRQIEHELAEGDVSQLSKASRRPELLQGVCDCAVYRRARVAARLRRLADLRTSAHRVIERALPPEGVAHTPPIGAARVEPLTRPAVHCAVEGESPAPPSISASRSPRTRYRWTALPSYGAWIR